MNAPHRIPPPLYASDESLAWLIHAARTTIDGSHPAYGNHLADVLDALVAYHEATDAGDAYAAAEELADAATALRNRADDALMEVRQ